MLTIIGSVLGFATSFLPAIMQYFQQKQQAQLQLQMLQLGIKQTEVEAAAMQTQAVYQDDAAVKGGAFIDGMRASVRPIITYIFFALFVAIKTCALISAIKAGGTLLTSLPQLWDNETNALFAAVVTFWFGGRAFEKIYSNK